MSPAASAALNGTLTLDCGDCGTALACWMNAGAVPPGVDVGTGVFVGPGVGVVVGVGVAPVTTKASAQSDEPSACEPGVVKSREPELAKVPTDLPSLRDLQSALTRSERFFREGAR